jgi:hypothetical protein
MDMNGIESSILYAKWNVKYYGRSLVFAAVVDSALVKPDVRPEH